MIDTQEYSPPCEVFRGSKLSTKVMVLPFNTDRLVDTDVSEPSTSLLSGSTHFTEVGRSEVTVQVREYLLPARREFEVLVIFTSCVNSAK